jgi:nondiscriminating aspartyl-tRNA synthetase
MERVLTCNLAQHIGHEVRIAGWLHNIRRLGGVTFVLLRDATGTTQIILESNEEFGPLVGLQNESVVEVIGSVVAEANAPGGLELHRAKIEVLSAVRDVVPFPINKKALNVNLDTFLDNAPFGLRHPSKSIVFRMAGAVMQGFRAHLDHDGFTEIATPKIVGSATEGGANVFELKYFDRPAYLAQSPQFYKQIMVGILEKVYEVAPVFRAEPHSTSRHLNEYVSMDVEFGFIKDHTTVMDLLARLLTAMLEHIRCRCATEAERLGVSWPLVPEKFPSIYFPDAQRLLKQLHGESTEEELDLTPQHERWLCEWARREFASDFLFVTGFPMAKRPFYTHPNPEDPRYANGFDLLFRGLELVTGGQRLHLYEDYVRALTERGMPLDRFEWYTEAFKFGMPPHGGFAIGMERFLMQLLGRQNLREVTLFPRDLNRLMP